MLATPVTRWGGQHASFLLPLPPPRGHLAIQASLEALSIHGPHWFLLHRFLFSLISLLQDSPSFSLVFFRSRCSKGLYKSLKVTIQECLEASRNHDPQRPVHHCFLVTLFHISKMRLVCPSHLPYIWRGCQLASTKKNVHGSRTCRSHYATSLSLLSDTPSVLRNVGDLGINKSLSCVCTFQINSGVTISTCETKKVRRRF